MRPDRLEVELLSETCWASGGAGEVDVELDVDELGLPVLGGKALHGLLVDTWLSLRGCFPHLHNSGRRLFGYSGDLTEATALYVGSARLPSLVRQWVAAALTRADERLDVADIREAASTVRTQTAVARPTGAAATGSLRTLRSAMAGLSLQAPLVWKADLPPAAQEQATCCLALCALATRETGLRRTRGLGFIRLTLDGDLRATRTAAAGAGRP